MLLTWDYYQQITGDTTTDDAVFASAASAAQDLLEDAIGRPGFLELTERTETLTIEGAGYLYPTAVPVIDAPGFVVHDDVLYGATPDLDAFVGLIGSCAPARATVTYSGGYRADTAPGYMLRDLAFVTWAILRPTAVLALAETPGAQSVSVGDVSISYGPGGAAGGHLAGLGVSWSPYTLRHRTVDP